MKNDENAQKWVVWGVRDHSVIDNIIIRYNTYGVLFDFNRNYASILYTVFGK